MRLFSKKIYLFMCGRVYMDIRAPALKAIEKYITI